MKDLMRRILRRWGSRPHGATVLGVADQAVVSLANFGTTVLIGKFAGVSELGLYALAFTVVILMMTVQECFITTPYTVYCRQLDGRSGRSLLGNLVILALLIGGLCSAVALAVGWVSDLAPIAWVLALAAPAVLMRELARRAAIAHLNMVGTLRLDLVWAVMQVSVLGVLVLGDQLTARTALGVMSVAGAAGAVYGLWMHRRRLHVDREHLPGHWRTAGRFGRWLCAARMTSVVHSYIVPWLLGLMVGLNAVGGFAAAFALIAAANPLLMGLTNVLEPRAAEAAASGGARAVSVVVQRATIGLIAVTAAFVAVIVLFAGDLLVLIYGSDYATFAAVTAVLAISLLTSIVGVGADHGLRALERPQACLVASCCGLTTTVTFTLLLVPAVGFIGGAYALTLGGGVSSAVRLIAFRRLVRNESTDPLVVPIVGGGH